MSCYAIYNTGDNQFKWFYCNSKKHGIGLGEMLFHGEIANDPSFIILESYSDFIWFFKKHHNRMRQVIIAPEKIVPKRTTITLEKPGIIEPPVSYDQDEQESQEKKRFKLSEQTKNFLAKIGSKGAHVPRLITRLEPVRGKFVR